MGLLNPDVISREGLAFVKRESAFGTYVPPVANDSTPGEGLFRFLMTKVKQDQQRAKRTDVRPTRSMVEFITHKFNAEWEVESYLLPSGAAGTAPDMGAFFRNWFGVQTINASTSVVYTLSDSQTALGSLSMNRVYSSIAGEQLAGMFSEEFGISLKGGEDPKVKFSGFARTVASVNRTTLNAQAAGGASSISVDFPDALENGAVVQVGTSNGGGAGHVLSAKALTSGVGGVGSIATFTVSPTIIGTQASGSDVIPFAPADSVAGAVVPGIVGSCQIGDYGGTLTSIPILDFELTAKNGAKPVNDQCFQQFIEDYTLHTRELTGKLTLRARRDLLPYLGTRKRFVRTNITVGFGNTAGNTFTLVLGCELRFGEGLVTPEGDDRCSIDLPFEGQASTSGADELSATFT